MIQITIDNKVKVKYLPEKIEEEIKKTFTIFNPEFVKAMRFRKIPKSKWPIVFLNRKKEKGIWRTTKIQKYLYYYKVTDSLELPRNSFYVLKKILNQNKEPYRLIKKFTKIKKQNFKFHFELRKEKGQEAIKKLKGRNGIIQAPTGSGKTVMACWLIANYYKCRTCIIVDTNELMEQWKGNKEKKQGILYFLKEKVGKIAAGKADIKPITIALMQTLRTNPQLANNFDCLIIDECHIAAVESYEKIIKEYKGEYTLGLSATPTRKDGKTEVMHWLLGQKRVEIKYEEAERTKALYRVIPTNFKTEKSFTTNYMMAMNDLVEDKKRNQLIADQILGNIDFFGVQLILSKRTEHLYSIQNLLPSHFQMLSRILIGSINKKDRKDIIKDLQKGKLKILFATESLLGKGFDEDTLSILHMATPIKDENFLKQCIGRITRTHPDKEEAIIIDYWDNLEPSLSRSLKQRRNLYDKFGIESL